MSLARLGLRIAGFSLSDGTGEVAHRLEEEHPGIRWADEGEPIPSTSIDIAEWRAPGADLPAFDRRIRAVESNDHPFGLIIKGSSRDALLEPARQILTRYQRLFPRRNRSSSSSFFIKVLRRHRALFDVGKPWVRADLEHAVDTWQWLLRLDPACGVAVQLAALFHDIQRLEAHADDRIEHHHASDHVAFERGGAHGGAHAARLVLNTLGAPSNVSERVFALIQSQDRPDDDREGELLNDADSLSFFSLKSAGFLAFFGAEQTRIKIAYTLDRMREESRRWLAAIRCPDAITEMVEATRASSPRASC
jgi:hypothetical protein